jgi:cytochrome b pre-mRNA-processing protein 3
MGMNPSGPGNREPPARGSILAWRVLATLLLAVLAIALLWNMGAEDRAIARMDPVHRREVYERALGEVRSLCGTSPRTDALEKRCAEQIQFIVKFPECDAPCQDIARTHAPRPTK